jgi:hypothetical protein
MTTLRVVGEFSQAIQNGDTFAQERVYVGHTCDGRLILHLQDDIEGQALTIDGWICPEDGTVREAQDNLVNALLHCTCLVFTAKGDHRGSLQIDGTEPLKLVVQQVAVAL